MLNLDLAAIVNQHVTPHNHPASDYFAAILALVQLRGQEDAPGEAIAAELRRLYCLVEDEIKSNQGLPLTPVSFGTSGWRGIIGKDLFNKSIAQVTMAIIGLYLELEEHPDLGADLGVATLAEARRRGCVVGYDNRFGNPILAQEAIELLTTHGFTVYNAGEATTGILSAAVLRLGAAFSINFTPSHNPLEYGGIKYNAADGGPAAATLTNRITANARALMAANTRPEFAPKPALVQPCNALQCWIELVKSGFSKHGLAYEAIVKELAATPELVLAVDCVHGASRVTISALLQHPAGERFHLLRAEADPTFGGIAPEPSTKNMQPLMRYLQSRPEPLKLGVLMDPDADRIRFTDGVDDLDMNQFGAMAYHYLHEGKHKKGLVAKTVATSNFANAIAIALGERVFEPRVGFKEFKPVIAEALVCFEESDGITVLGHTPEKDAYIGLLLALDMVMGRRQNLGDYLRELQAQFGAYFPAKDGVRVSQQGEELRQTLGGLNRHQAGTLLQVGAGEKRVAQLLTIDGYKVIFEDGGWILIRPSGTEPKVRFYVEARTAAEKQELFATANQMLREIGLLA